MAKNEKKTITVNDVEHDIDDLTEQQIACQGYAATISAYH